MITGLLETGSVTSTISVLNVLTWTATARPLNTSMASTRLLKRAFAMDPEFRMIAVNDPDLELLWADLGKAPPAPETPPP